MDFNDNVAMWSAVVGFLLPLVIATVNRQRWSSSAKGVVAFLACAVAAAGTAYVEGDITRGSDVVTAFLVVFSSAIGTYHAFYKPSGIAPAVETKTG